MCFLILYIYIYIHTHIHILYIHLCMNALFVYVYKNVRKILEELHLLLTPDQAHKKVFSEACIIGLKNAKSLKDTQYELLYLNQIMRADLNYARWQIVHVKYASQLKINKISKRNLTFLKVPWIAIKTMIYLFECKKCKFKFTYVGSTVTKFRF